MKGQEHYTLCIVVCTIYILCGVYILYTILYYINILHAVDDSSSDIKNIITELHKNIFIGSL